MDPWRRTTTHIGLFAVVCVFCVAGIAILHHLYLSYPAFDPSVLDRIHTYATPTLTFAAKALSAIGSPRTVWPLTILLFTIFWLRRPRRSAYLLALTMAASGMLETLIKLIARRPRPTLPWVYVDEHSYSFPSGHATLVVALYGVLAWITFRTACPPWLRAIVIFLAVTLIPAIGLSRLYLGAHHPSDVLAGYLTGAAVLSFFLAADLAF